MKSTLADNKQLFNVKTVATAGKTADALVDGELGVFNVATGLTVVPGNFSALPDKFSLVLKYGEKTYYSFDEIEKAKMKNITKQDYKAPVSNIWKTTIKSCACIEGVQLYINLHDMSLIQQYGLTWKQKDFVVEVTPQELKCFCSCSGDAPVYENNVMTMIMVNKVNAMKSPFYKAYSMIDITGITTAASAPGAPETGDMYINTGSNLLFIYDGAAWVEVGDDTGKITDLEAFVEANKAANTGGVEADYGPYLDLYLESIINATPNYNDLEINYVYPRGVKLNPSLSVDGNFSSPFTEVQAMSYEINSGYDLRAEEFDNMNYYTNLNFQNTLYDGIATANLIYQFQNQMNYNVVNFEFMTDKVNSNDGDKRLFGVLLGFAIPAANTAYTSVKNMFGL